MTALTINRDFANLREGQTVELEDGLADLLIRRGYASAAEPKPKPRGRSPRRKTAPRRETTAETGGGETR